MRFNVCVINEMAPFWAFPAFIKGRISFYNSSRNGNHPKRRDGRPTRYESVRRWDMGFPKVSCLFVLCVVCNRRRSYLPEIMRLGVVRPGVGEPLCFMAALPWADSWSKMRKLLYLLCPCLNGCLYTCNGRNGWVCVEHGRRRRPRAFVVWMWTKTCLSHPNAINSCHTKSPSSPNCRKHRMWELGRHGRWS